MIPKIIHYCWLSDDPVPMDLQNYMKTWKRYLPDYTFIHWNFKKFPKSQSKWVSDAFDNKKYAFAADYIRLYALYNYGGIYLDMDVELLKPYGNMLTLSTMIGFENSKSQGLEVAAFGVEKRSSWLKICLDYYDSRSFVNSDGSFNEQPLPGVIKHLLLSNGYSFREVNSISEAASVSGKVIPVFPSDFFSPKNHLNGVIQESNNTYTIHHFAGSWLPLWQQFEKKIWHSLGMRDFRILLRIKNLLLYGTIKSIPTASKNKL